MCSNHQQVAKQHPNDSSIRYARKTGMDTLNKFFVFDLAGLHE